MTENVIEKIFATRKNAKTVVLNNERYHLSVPIAGNGRIGVAGYSTEHFSLKGQIVSLRHPLPVPTAEDENKCFAVSNGKIVLKEVEGRKPIKGVDYFTETDKAEMVSAVVAALPKYNGEVVDV